MDFESWYEFINIRSTDHTYRLADMYCNQLQVVVICKSLVWQLTDLWQLRFVLLFTNLQKRFDLWHSQKKLFLMEFKNDSVIALYLTGKPHVGDRALQHLNVNKSVISRTIARYCDTGSVPLRPKNGWKKKTIRTPGIIWKVRAVLSWTYRENGCNT